MAARRIQKRMARKIARMEAGNAALARENAALEAGLGSARDGRRAAHAREVLHTVLHEPRMMRKMTLAGMDAFEYILQRFVALSDADPGAPPFRDGGRPDPGGPLRYDEALLLALTRTRARIPRGALGVLFGAGPDAVSRYLGHARPILDAILPTPRILRGALASAGKEAGMLAPGMELAPGRIVTGARQPGEGRGPASTGVVANNRGWIIGMGRTVPGRVPRAALCRGLLADLGPAYRTAGGAADGEPRAVNMLEEFGTVSGMHVGTLEELNDDINTAAGLVNLDLMGVEELMRLQDMFRIGI